VFARGKKKIIFFLGGFKNRLTFAARFERSGNVLNREGRWKKKIN
jgi:hypothetical protein